MKRATLLVNLQHLWQRLLSRQSDPAGALDVGWLSAVRKAWHHFLHASVHETQVLLISGLVVGIGAGLGAVAFRELISGCTFFFFQVLRPMLSTVLGPAAVIVLPAIGGLVFGPLIYLFVHWCHAG